MRFKFRAGDTERDGEGMPPSPPTFLSSKKNRGEQRKTVKGETIKSRNY